MQKFEDMPLLLQLAELKKFQHNVVYRSLLSDLHQELLEAQERFCITKTRESLERLNGVWARAVRVVNHLPPMVDPSAPIQERKAA